MKEFPLFCITLIFLSGLSQISRAQSDFAPVGAEWYHNGYGGDVVYKSYAEKDTTVLGKNCRRILQKVYVTPKYLSSAAMYKASEPLYIFGNEDTTFIYNSYYNKFTPLYVFNVAAGDTVRLNPLPGVSAFMPCKRDTNLISLSFVVDSVKNVSYDGIILKTVYSTSLIEKTASLGWSRVGFGSKDPVHNVYAQKIGSLYAGFLPYCINACCGLTVEGYPNPDTILCYNDPLHDIHLISGNCDKDYIYTSIDEIRNSENKIQIYPNPATDMVSIVNANLHPPSSLLVLNALGQIVFRQEYKAGNKITFYAGSFARGIYFVRLENKTHGTISTGKLVKE